MTEDPYKVTATHCRARTKNKTEEWPEGEPCDNKCGKGTEHSGEPFRRCKFHGGASIEGREHYRYKSGLTSKIGLVELRTLAEEYQNDPNIFNFRDIIAMIKAALTMALNGGDVDKAVNYAMQITRAIERLSAIEVDRGYYMKVTEVEVVIDKVVAIMQKHIKDKDTLDNIAAEFTRHGLLSAPDLRGSDDEG